jgi:Tfp pilus assembly protein PilF
MRSCGGLVPQRRRELLHRRFLLPLAVFLCVGAPLAAETPDDLDKLADRTATEASGLALAREQAARGEWLEALASLERVLALFPKSRAARLEHAMLLCRVGDLPGAEAEFRRLKAKDYDEGALARARADCRPLKSQER